MRSGSKPTRIAAGFGAGSAPAPSLEAPAAAAPAGTDPRLAGTEATRRSAVATSPILVSAEDEDFLDASAGARQAARPDTRMRPAQASGCCSSPHSPREAGVGARFEAAAVDSTAAVIQTRAPMRPWPQARQRGVASQRAAPVEFADAAGRVCRWGRDRVQFIGTVTRPHRGHLVA